MAEPKKLHYRRARFVTQLPVEYRYSPSHYWIGPQADGSWRVGLTKFATRMLGEMVELGFDAELGAAVESGQILGWVEGFKAIADVYCIAEGTFAGTNLALKQKVTLVNKDPYGAGWLYQVRGNPDAKCVDVHGYEHILDKTIDKILEKESSEGS